MCRIIYSLSGLINYTLGLTHGSESNLRAIYAYFYIILSMININKTDFLYISISVREYIKFNDLETASN